MALARLLFVLSALLWSWLAWMGVDAMRDIATQQVPGYPSAEQRQFYLYFPLALAVLSCALLGATWSRRGGCALSVIGGLMLVLLLPYLLFYTGGV